jgi:hypothetical protein
VGKLTPGENPMKIVSETPGMRDFTINDGKVISKNRDGKFHVSDSLGKSLVKSGEFMASTISLRNASGYVCEDCGFVSVFKDRCGKCGSTDLNPEDAA